MAEGHYVVVKDKSCIVSALGAIVKPNNKVRIIHDCSRPSAKAVNDYVTLQEKMSYQSIRDVSDLVNTGYYMCKIDLRSAYRSIPIHPSNYTFTGLKWTFRGQNQLTYMLDKRLMFGSRLAPNIFHRLSQALRRIMYKLYNIRIIAYLHDFLIASPSYMECRKNMLLFIRLLRRLGLDIAWEKVVSPTQDITFLGININSLSMQITLPEDKVSSLQTMRQVVQVPYQRGI